MPRLSIRVLLALMTMLMTASPPSLAREKILFAHLFDESIPHHQDALWAARELERRTNGRYVMEVLGKGTLGATDTQHMEAVKAGLADVTYLGFSHAADIYSPVSIGSGPYVFRDYRRWEAFRESPLFQELKA
jgi:TRAP-type C4-dicarboxylate transport system substrate-binding protein